MPGEVAVCISLFSWSIVVHGSVLLKRIRYGSGVHAPGRCSNRSTCSSGNSTTEPYLCMHRSAPTSFYCGHFFALSACATAHLRIQTRNCSVLLAHAAAVSIFRAKYQRGGAVIGFTADSGWCDPDALFVADGSCRIQTNRCRSEPWSANASDVAAAERALLFSFAIFMDPLIFGDWPEEVRRRAGCCAATAAIFVLPKPLCYHCPSS